MLIGVIFIAVASISWGTTGATMTLLSKETAIGPLLVGWVRVAVGAGVSYAVYAVAAKGLLTRIAPLPVAAMTFFLAAVFLAPVLLGERAPLRLLATGWPLLLYLGMGPTAVAYVLFTVGLRRVPATVAGIVSLIEPLTATLLGVVAFGESLGPLGVAGPVLLLASLGLLVAPVGR